MKGLRGITTTVTLVALGSFAAVPVAAQANSLLSGYGGPGQGSQAILGAALLGGPSGGGGGGGGESTTAGPGATGASAAGTPAAGGASGRGSGGQTSAGTGGRRSAGARARRAATLPPTVPTAAEEAAVSSPALGISGPDLLYILGGLGVLGLTATLTRGLVRRQR
jgi:hypothetical protein